MVVNGCEPCSSSALARLYRIERLREEYGAALVSDLDAETRAKMTTLGIIHNDIDVHDLS